MAGGIGKVSSSSKKGTRSRQAFQEDTAFPSRAAHFLLNFIHAITHYYSSCAPA
jgi:hypothetical protein